MSYEMVSKKILIEFASPRIRAVDVICDLRKAVESAGLNLYSRHNMQLQPPHVIDNNVIVEVRIPKEQEKSFSAGRRLRGISLYLLKHCNGRYDPYLVGERLLTYTEISKQDFPVKGIATEDRFEAIVDFARLLQRTDEPAIHQASRIIAILDEEK